jgi:hypothetical protein
MNVQAPNPEFRQTQKTLLVDCDVHPRLRSPDQLKPYMSERWWNHFQTYGARKRNGVMKGHPYPKSGPSDGSRRDAWPPAGGPPGSDLDFMRQQHLDLYGVDYGIINPLWVGAGDQNLDLGSALASAQNDWQMEHWALPEPRLRPSIVVNYDDAASARAEIHKRAREYDYAQVMLLSRSAEALGRKRYWPIYEAAVEHGLPVGIHVFGFSGLAITPTGWPSFYMEEMSAHGTSVSAIVMSMVMEGLFEHLPDLRIVLIESGFAWLPSLAWRLDKCWARMRDETPHVRRPPSEYIRENVYVTTQPIEEPNQPGHLEDVFRWIGWDRVLFSSDYPHWDFDDPKYVIPRGVRDDNRRKILGGNAAALYRLG